MKYNNFTDKLSIRSRLVLSILSIVLTVEIISGFLFLSSFIYQLQQSVIDLMLDKSYQAQTYAMGYFKFKENVDSQAYLNKVAPYMAVHIADSTDTEIEIYSGSELVGKSNKYDIDSELSGDVDQARSIKSYSFIYKNNRVSLSFSSPIYLPDGSIVGVVRSEYPMDTQYRQILYVILVFLAILVISLLLTLAVSYLLSDAITKPLKCLLSAVNAVKEGDFSSEIPSLYNPEFDELGEAFNLMSTRINSYMSLLRAQQKQLLQFFNNTTHQLKTPLTSIIGYAQMIQLNSDNDQVCEDAFIIEEAGETLYHSIETILDKSKHKDLWFPSEITVFSLAQMIQESIRLLSPRILRHNIEIEQTISENIQIKTDRTQLQEVILALLDNAILHSECQKITIFCKFEDGDTNDLQRYISIHVKDDGMGIDKFDQPYIFQSFYRVEGVTTSGNGLGLSICENIMQRLGGNIVLKSGLSQGAEFVLEHLKYYC